MAWIESHQELAAHPKTLRLARLLGDSVPAVIGRIHLLWWWALSYAPDGDLSRFDDDEIATPMRWEGDPAVLRRSLIEVGFVNPDGSLHDWHEYAGRLVEQRALTREQRASGGRNRMAQLTSEQRSMLAKQAANARWLPSVLAPPSINMPATVPNSTEPNSTEPPSNITRSMRKPKTIVPKIAESWIDFIIRMKVKYPALDVDEQIERCQAYWDGKGKAINTYHVMNWLANEIKYQAERESQRSDNGRTGQNTAVSKRKPDTEDGSDDPRWTVIRSGRNQAPDGDDG